MADVEKLYSDHSFVADLRRLAKYTSQIVWSHHAKKRMKERDVSTQQVLNVLRSGTIHEPVYFDNINGSWRATLRRTAAGVEVKVGVAIDLAESVIVITVI